jgi:GTP cyclohydrolase I
MKDNVVKLTPGDVAYKAEMLARSYVSGLHPSTKRVRIFGVPRGGIPAAYAFGEGLLVYNVNPVHVTDAVDADVIVDDILDSGATKKAYSHYDVPFLCLVDKGQPSYKGKWVVFPWEKNEQYSAEDIPVRLLQYIGEEPSRGGLKETPARFIKAWQHWAGGYKVDVPGLLKTFEDGAEGAKEMVVVKDIPFYSHCEHHLAPFFGKATVGYIPQGKIVGLSKINRVVDAFARRLQVQERLTSQIADALNDALEPIGVGVILKCRHLCMESRGVCQQGHHTITSALRGALVEGVPRNEFMHLSKD